MAIREQLAGPQVFKLGRFFAVSSFFVVLLSAVVLVYYYRGVAIATIAELGAKSNLLLAETVLHSVQDQLADYFDEVNELTAEQLSEHPMPAAVQHAINELMGLTGVARVKLYNRQGIVVFSTKPSQIGNAQHDNPGFINAIDGQSKAKLIYRDTFNVFDNATEVDNLIQTYVPVRRAATLPVTGVFELYTDANHLADRTTIAELKIGAGAILVLALVYAVLLVIVRYAEQIFQRQQDVIREHSHAMELLSAQVLKSQEAEKRIISWELHEGVTQVLASVKFHLDAALAAVKGADADKGRELLERAIPVVVDAIQNVRTTAMDLRPSSLDDFGVLKTLEWLLPRFRAQYPELDLGFEATLAETDIPDELKIVIYRLVQEVLNRFVSHPGAEGLDARLSTHDGGLALRLVLRGKDLGALDENGKAALAKGTGLALLKERVYLSGGNFKLSSDQSGGIVAEMTWSS